jgi:type I restriction enzyme S subunit
MTEWTQVKVEQVKSNEPNAMATGPFGSSISARFFVDEGIPVIRGTNLSPDVFVRLKDKGLVFIAPEKASEFSRSKVKMGDLVFTCWGTVNQVGLIDRKSSYSEYIISNKQMKLTPNQDVANSLFLYYLFSSPAMQDSILGNSIGSSVPGFNLGQLRSMEIVLPPLPEQRAIASVLSSLDDKIDLLHRQNATLEKLAETLFRQWFVDASRNTDNNGKFGDFIEDTLGGDWGKETSQGDYDTPVYCMRGTDIADLCTGLANRVPIRFIKQAKLDKASPNHGDILIEISGGTESQSTGRTTYLSPGVEALFELPLFYSNFCRLLRVRDVKYSLFLYCYLRHLYDSDEFFNLENGTSGIKNLDYKAFLFDVEYPMPSNEEAASFSEQVKPYFAKINSSKKQIAQLQSLRDLLLPKLMSGEVRVRL